MKKISFSALRFILPAIIIAFISTLSSCSSSKTAMLCPDLHKHKSAAMAMIKQYRHERKVSRQASYQTDGTTAARIRPDSIPNGELPAVGALPPKGLASLADDVPTFASAMEKFKSLDQEQRLEAKKAVEKYLTKRPVLKKVALKRFDKLDAQYPAAEKRSEGGGMDAGEILSIVAIVLAFLLPPVGLILGIISLVILNGGGSGWARTLAIAAIIIGAVLTIVGGVVIVVIR